MRTETTTLGVLLRSLREKKGLSSRQLGEMAGCDPSYVRRLELGDREVYRRSYLDAIAAALDLDRSDEQALYMAAGYLPWKVDDLGQPGREAVAALGEALDSLDQWEADELARMVRNIVTWRMAEKWREERQ